MDGTTCATIIDDDERNRHQSPRDGATRMADRGGGPAISFQDVSKHFPAADGSRLEVLRDVSFDVRIGDVVAILGPSGSGKSTLLNMAAGLIFPDAGRVVVMGQATPRRGLEPRRLHVPGRPPAAVAGGGPQRRARARGGRHAGGRTPAARARGARPGRARRVRAVLSVPAVRRHAQPGRARAQPRRRAADPADGRAVLAARCADPQQHAPRTRSHSRHARDDDPVRHARRGGGGGSRRSRRDDVGAAGSRPPHDRYFAAAAADRNAGGRRAHR